MYMQGTSEIILMFVVHTELIYMNFIEEKHNMRVTKENETNFFNLLSGCASRDIPVPYSKLLFRTHGISFDIDTGLIWATGIKVHFLVDNSYSCTNGLN